MKKTVYVALSQFCEEDERPRQILLDAGFQVAENKTGKRLRAEEMLEVLKDVDAVLAAVEPYPSQLLAKLPQLKCISRCGSGTDAIDLAAAKEYHKIVLTTPNEVIEPVAQIALAMILALARNLTQHHHDFLQEEWKKRTGYLLSEWTIGIVGFGRIGRQVADYLKPFGPPILVCDPGVKPESFPEIKFCSDLASLLSQSDLVTLHLHRSPQEGVLMGLDQFQKMKPGSFFVNTSRGYLVDENALLKVLQSGQIAGAALDVFEKEPYHGPLASFPQVILTPHVATLTRASRVAMEIKAARNIVDFFERG